MKHLQRFLPLMAAVLLTIPTAGTPVFAHYQHQNSAVRTIVTAGAIGAGAGAVTSIITGNSSPLKGAAVGAVIGAGSGAIYQAVRYNHNGYDGNHYRQQGGYYRNDNENWRYNRGNQGYYGHQDAYYHNYPNHQQGYIHHGGGERGYANTFGNGGGSRGCHTGYGQNFRRIRSGW